MLQTNSAEQNRDLFGSLVRGSSDYIAIARLDGTICYLNAAAGALHGLDPNDPAGVRLADCVFRDDVPYFASTVLADVERTGRWSGDLRLRRARSAAPVPVACSVFALTAEDGARVALAAVSRDLRERSRLEEGLRLLARIGAATVDSLDYQRTLRGIAGACIDGFAAYCLIDVMPPGGYWERTAQHRDAAFVPLLLGLSRPSGNHPIARAIEAGESFVTTIDDDWIRHVNANDDRVRAVRRLRVRSIATTPVVTPSGEVVGALTCALDDQSLRDDYDDTDLAFVEEVGRRAGAAVANARLYSRERRIAVEMQSACLPSQLPAYPGVALDSTYMPGSGDLNVGGDWYDAFLLPDGRLLLTVGDVLGHGLAAAVLMMRLRIAMRAAALVNQDPNVVLRVADQTMRSSDRSSYATALVAIYDARTRSVDYASAGHPGPLLRTAQGSVVDCSRSGMMIGLRSGDESETFVIETPPGTALVFYTDGLVETHKELDEGPEHLRKALARGDVLDVRHPAEALAQAVLEDERPRDDVAILIATFS